MSVIFSLSSVSLVLIDFEFGSPSNSCGIRGEGNGKKLTRLQIHYPSWLVLWPQSILHCDGRLGIPEAAKL